MGKANDVNMNILALVYTWKLDWLSNGMQANDTKWIGIDIPLINHTPGNG